jgi:hypothetical protein
MGKDMKDMEYYMETKEFVYNELFEYRIPVRHGRYTKIQLEEGEQFKSVLMPQSWEFVKEGVETEEGKKHWFCYFKPRTQESPEVQAKIITDRREYNLLFIPSESDGLDMVKWLYTKQGERGIVKKGKEGRRAVSTTMRTVYMGKDEKGNSRYSMTVIPAKNQKKGWKIFLIIGLILGIVIVMSFIKS